MPVVSCNDGATASISLVSGLPLTLPSKEEEPLCNGITFSTLATVVSVTFATVDKVAAVVVAFLGSCVVVAIILMVELGGFRVVNLVGFGGSLVGVAGLLVVEGLALGFVVFLLGLSVGFIEEGLEIFVGLNVDTGRFVGSLEPGRDVVLVTLVNGLNVGLVVDGFATSTGFDGVGFGLLPVTILVALLAIVLVSLIVVSMDWNVVSLYCSVVLCSASSVVFSGLPVVLVGFTFTNSLDVVIVAFFVVVIDTAGFVVTDRVGFFVIVIGLDVVVFVNLKGGSLTSGTTLLSNISWWGSIWQHEPK